MNNPEDVEPHLNGSPVNLLYGQIKELVSSQVSQMLRQWNRRVPMGDLFLDR